MAEHELQHLAGRVFVLTVRRGDEHNGGNDLFAEVPGRNRRQHGAQTVPRNHDRPVAFKAMTAHACFCPAYEILHGGRVEVRGGNRPKATVQSGLDGTPDISPYPVSMKEHYAGGLFHGLQYTHRTVGVV